MRTDILKEKLAKLDRPPKFIYVIPDFQNPAGVSMSYERRQEILKLAEKDDLLILEDSPYRNLRYEGDNIPSFQELDPSGRVITVYTFSKILSPGIRLGWIVASPEIISRLVTAKQSTDACTPAFTQCVVNEFCRRNLLHEHIGRLKTIYSEKMHVMLQALEDFMPDRVKWTKPQGGLFLWMTLPEGIDTSTMLVNAIGKEGVAYTPGMAFYVDGKGQNTMRLNFSYPSTSQIREGVERLARVIKKELS
jgi:2-aminoadipate transaminase